MAVKDKLASELNEVELYFLIDMCGAYLWRMNHDMCDGRIEEKHWAAIDADMTKVREQQKEAVGELPRVGVSVPLDSEGKPTEEYWVWYRRWDSWKKGLSDDEWREVDIALGRGLTAEEVAKYKALAFKDEGAKV